jgi:hypothetical protein
LLARELEICADALLGSTHWSESLAHLMAARGFQPGSGEWRIEPQLGDTSLDADVMHETKPRPSAALRAGGRDANETRWLAVALMALAIVAGVSWYFLR